MKVVILAAGMGMRLEDTIPKPMIVLSGNKTILDYQIKNLSKYVPIDDIYVVIGYKKELIMEKYPELIYIYNHKYAQTNTAKSLLLALRKIDDDVIWMNGDVFFEKRIIKRLIDAKNSALLVQKKECGEEEIKYALNGKGYIEKLSKEVKGGKGEAVGINMVKRKDLDKFIKRLKLVKPKDYFEKALEDMVRLDKVKIEPIDIKKVFCMEIDFPKDLKEVKRYIRVQKK